MKKVKYKELAGFYIPLAMLPMLISLTHTMINSALARLPSPELSLAVFTVIKSLANVLTAPTQMTRQLVLSLVKGKRSFLPIKRFSWTVAFILSGLFLLLRFSPLGPWIFKHIFSFKNPEEIKLATSVLLITAFLPLVVSLRNINHALATSLKKTGFILPGVIIRLVIIFLFLWWVVQSRIISGVTAGTLAWTVGIGIEGVFILGFLKFKYGGYDKIMKEIPGNNEKQLSLSRILRFYLPLALTMVLTMFLQPVIQGGIARSQLPVRSLAAYGVAWSLVLIIAGALMMLNQVAVVYIENWKKVRKFSLFVGAIISVTIIILGLTPLGFWILNSIIGVSPDIAQLAQKTVLAFCVYPVIQSFRESYWGVMMQRQTTNIIGLAKLINMLSVVVFLFSGLQFFSLEPAVLGAIGFTIGEGIETLLIWYYSHASRRRQQLLEG